MGPGAVSQAWQVWIWHMKVMVLRAGHVPGTVLGAEDFSVKESLGSCRAHSPGEDSTGHTGKSYSFEVTEAWD